VTSPPSDRLTTPDGAKAINITNNPAADTDADWSPDGPKIAFASDRDGNVQICVMNVDGTGIARLTNHMSEDRQPSWSPDGGKIAFRSDRDGNSEIYVMNADGTNPVRLTNDPATDNRLDGANPARLTTHSTHSPDDEFPAWRP